jgi:hypothetical protein
MAKRSTFLLRCVILFGRICLQNLQLLSFVLSHSEATIRAAIDRGKRISVAALFNARMFEGIDYFVFRGEPADDASKADHIRMNYRDGRNVRMWTCVVA